MSYKPGSGSPNCVEDGPGGTNPTGYTYDCNDERYIQVATFNNPDDNYQYFMIVNRRCSPYINESTPALNGGRRIIKIRFDADYSAFAGLTNWNIIDLETEQSVLTFDKTSSNLLDLGYFMPGEGKLYKIMPEKE